MRRLLLLLAVLGCLVAAASALTWMGVRHKTAVARATRQQGMIAFGQGDYDRAVSLLGTYLADANAQENDADALYAYGTARINLPLPQNQQVFDGIRIFERYLSCGSLNEARRREGRRVLLDLYVRGWHNRDATRLADEMLAADPRDAYALEQKLRALESSNDTSTALDVSRRLNQVAPSDLWAQRQTLELMHRTRAGDAAVMRYAESQRAAHAGDPHFDLLMAYACKLTDGGAGDAARWLRSAAERAPADAPFVTELSGQMDLSGLYADAGALVARVASAAPADVVLRRLHALRVYEAGQTQPLVAQGLAELAKPRIEDSETAGVEALALEQAGRMKEARQLTEKIAASCDDRAAAGWVTALRARLANPPLKAPARAAALRDAAERDDSSPILHQLLARAYSDLGETELSLGELRRVIDLAANWSEPHALGTAILSRTGRFDYALDAAAAALDRKPADRELQICLALARYRFDTVNERTSDYVKLEHDLADLIAKTGDPRLIPARVDLLSQTDRKDAAAKLIDATLSAKVAATPDVLVELAQVSDRDGLDRATAILDRAAGAFPGSPEVALARARKLSRAAQTAKGLQLLLDSAKGQADRTAWDLAVAQYREETGDPDALDDWERLGNAHADNLKVQAAVTYAPSRVRDREFWNTTIDRLKAITGEQGIEWRAERARYLLAPDNPTSEQREEAVRLLNQVVETGPTLPDPHRLLAIALRLNGDLPGSLKQWTVAHQMRPGNVTYARGWTDALFAAGRQADALRALDDLAAAAPALDDSTRLWIARQYADHGRRDSAIHVLRSDPASPEGAALLTTLEQHSRPATR